MTTKVTFTDEEKDVLRRAAYAVWQEVACDALVSTAEAVTIPRAEAMELALDADRPVEHIRRLTRSWDASRRDDLLRRFSEADYAQLKRIVRPAFPFDRYGM